MALPTGSKAPDFTLKSKSTGTLQDVRLSTNFGDTHTVLLFFPFAYTSVCTEEMCIVTQGISGYTDLEAEVYAISVDSPFSQEAWARTNYITIPVLSDFNKDVSKAYDVLYEDFIGFTGVSQRAAFVVNKEGIITYSWVADDPKTLPDFDLIKKAL